MKPSSQPPRTPSRLSESVHHQLNMYALAASAAGVGMVALAQPAEAKIIYTPAHKVIEVNHALYLDFNHDERTGFRIEQYWSSGSGTAENKASLDARALYSVSFQGVAGKASWPFHAYALKAGSEVGPTRPFGGQVMYYRFIGGSKREDQCTGSWVNVKNRCLGLKFPIKGKVHYGWARLSVTCSPYPSSLVAGVLTGYAYETIPNNPVITGKPKGPDVITLEPGSLGRLAQGSAGRLGK